MSPKSKMLAQGDSAPMFDADTATGDRFSLDGRAGSWTVVFFYPKANTPG
jgi:peroxiredoxin Q/BCP